MFRDFNLLRWMFWLKLTCLMVCLTGKVVMTMTFSFAMGKNNELRLKASRSYFEAATMKMHFTGDNPNDPISNYFHDFKCQAITKRKYYNYYISFSVNCSPDNQHHDVVERSCLGHLGWDQAVPERHSCQDTGCTCPQGVESSRPDIKYAPFFRSSMISFGPWSRRKYTKLAGHYVFQYVNLTIQ